MVNTHEMWIARGCWWLCWGPVKSKEQRRHWVREMRRMELRGWLLTSTQSFTTPAPPPSQKPERSQLLLRGVVGSLSSCLHSDRLHTLRSGLSAQMRKQRCRVSGLVIYTFPLTRHSHVGTWTYFSTQLREGPSCIILGLRCPFPDNFMGKNISFIPLQCTREVFCLSRGNYSRFLRLANIISPGCVFGMPSDINWVLENPS